MTTGRSCARKRPAAIVLAVFVASLSGASCAESRGERWNVILMMADDLACDDLSCYGSRRINTPILDELATQGLRLTSFYSGASVCSPSRMALLSGAYPARLGWRGGVLGHGFAPGTGMSGDVYTVAEAFRDAGYHTALVGKWHVGDQNLGPEHQGFDSCFFLRMSNNQNRDLIRDETVVQKDCDNRLLSEVFTTEAMRVIHDAGEEPFFLYLPWTAPHFPADPHPDWKGRSGKDDFADVVEELDHRVGQILETVDKAGIADRTLVVFTSDNGRQSGQEDPRHEPLLRGRKWQSWEGGTRVPCIVRLPGGGRRGQTIDEIVGAIDLFPTLAEGCGVEIRLPQAAQKMDGVSVWSTLVGAADHHPRSELLSWHGKGQATAIRSGPWKLFFDAGEKDPDVSRGMVLFDLVRDSKESRNIADEHPDVVRRLAARAREVLADVYGRQVPLGVVDGKPQPEKAEELPVTPGG